MIRLTIILFLVSNLALCQIKTNYVVIDIDKLTKEMYGNSKQRSIKTSRKNVAGTQVILKFEGEVPEVFKDYQIYNHNAIKTIILAGKSWAGYDNTKKIIGTFFITDYRYKEDLTIKVSDWMYIQPIEIKERLWIIPYDLYIKYEGLIDNNIDLYKCAIREVSKSEFLKTDF